MAEVKMRLLVRAEHRFDGHVVALDGKDENEVILGLPDAPNDIARVTVVIPRGGGEVIQAEAIAEVFEVDGKPLRPSATPEAGEAQDG